jgi:hypothetical protein
MDKNQLLVRVAAVVTTLAETDGAPESMLYMLCDMNMEQYGILRDVLVKADLVSISGNYVTLTRNGQITADRLNKSMKPSN